MGVALGWEKVRRGGRGQTLESSVGPSLCEKWGLLPEFGQRSDMIEPLN